MGTNPTPDTDPPAEAGPDNLGALRADVNDLAQTMGEQLGELARRLDAIEAGELHRVQLVQGEVHQLGPEDRVIIRLPAEAFADYGDTEPMANVIARVAADVLGTRRVLVLEDTAQIDIAKDTPDGA